jgi:hypothetical protein
LVVPLARIERIVNRFLDRRDQGPLQRIESEHLLVFFEELGYADRFLLFCEFLRWVVLLSAA